MTEKEKNNDLSLRVYKLRQLQSLSLESKIKLSEKRIRDWHEMNDGKAGTKKEKLFTNRHEEEFILC